MYVGIVYADIYVNRIDFLQNLGDMVADAASIFQIVRIIGGNLGLNLIECLERIGQQLGISVTSFWLKPSWNCSRLVTRVSSASPVTGFA